MKLHKIKRCRKAFAHFAAVCASCLIILLTGCSENEELNTYKANMDQFFENVKIYDSSINAIDPESETAVAELLALLDSMDHTFSQMASLEVPEDFPGVEQLADEASEYMTEAVSCYHQAFEGETYNAAMADAAKENYDRANLRVQYILSILHGDIPEEIYVYDEQPADSSESGAEQQQQSNTMQ